MNSSNDERNPVEELAEEFMARKRRGERPTLAEYVAKYPELAEDIRELFPALLMMEDLGGDSLAATRPHPGAATATVTQVGEYRILREVGRGGMGVVYEAEQESLGRRVALKLLPQQALPDAQQVRRFEREARAAAKLHHTNIVPVFGVGQDGATHYYAMQFIPGLGLDEVLEELKQLRSAGTSSPAAPATGRRQRTTDLSAQKIAQSLATGSFTPDSADDPVPKSSASTVRTSDSSVTRLPGGSELTSVSESDQRYWRSVARIGVQVGEALDYAHGQGILHRDIKPSNLLLDMKGTVWVTDFGLAKAGDADNLTHTGDIVGTIRYMAPERFQGQSDARSDLYSLGLTLYELLALRPAFTGRDRSKLIQQVLHEEPPRLRKLNRAVPRDLETIVHKAIAREPDRRYPRASDLVADLQRFVEDRPIRARRASTRERLWRWCRRNPMVASLITLVVLVAALGFAATFDQMQRAVAEEQRAREKEPEAREQSAELAKTNQKFQTTQETLRDTLYAADMNLVPVAWERDDLAQVLELLRRHQPESGQPDRRGFEWHYWDRLCHGEERAVDLPGPADHAVFSRDGGRLAVAGPVKSADKRDYLTVWDTVQGKELFSVRDFKNSVSSLAFNADGSRLAVGSTLPTKDLFDETAVAVYETATGRRLSSLPGKKLVAQGTHVSVSALALSADGSRLATATCSGDHKAKVWDAAGAELFAVDAKFHVDELLFGAGGKWLLARAASSRDQSTWSQVWEIGKTKELFAASSSSDVKIGLPLYSPGADRIAVPATRLGVSEVTVTEVASGKVILSIPGAGAQAVPLGFSSDGARLAVETMRLGKSQGIQLWDVTGRKKLVDLAGGFDRPNRYSRLVFSRDGRRVAGFGHGSVIHVWDAATGAALRFLKGHPGSVVAVMFSADGRRLWSIGSEGSMKTWLAAPGTAPLPVQVIAGKLTTTAMAPDGTRLAALTSPDARAKVRKVSSLRVWDKSGKLLFSAQNIPGSLHGSAGEFAQGELMFNADGSRLAAVLHDFQTPRKYKAFLRMWSVPDGKEILTVDDLPIKLAGSRAPGAQPDQEENEGADKGRQTHKNLGSYEDVFAVLAINHSPVQDNISMVPVAQRGKSTRPPPTRPSPTRPPPKKKAGPKVPKEIVAIDELRGYCSVQFSPDGKQLALNMVISPEKVSGVFTSRILVWNAASGKRVLTLGPFSGFSSVRAFSPDGSRLAVAEKERGPKGRRLRVYDAAGKELYAVTGSYFSAAFSPNGKYLVAADPGFDIEAGLPRGELVLLDAASGQKLWSTPGLCYSLAFSPDGTLMAAGTVVEPASGLSELRLWDLATQRLLFARKAHSLDIRRLTFSPDGRRLVTLTAPLTTSGSEMKLWDLAGHQLLYFKRDFGSIADLAYSRDSTRLYYTTDGNLNRFEDLFHVLDGRPRADEKSRPAQLVRAIEEELPGELIVIGGGGGYWLNRVAFTPDGKYAVATGGAVILYDLTTGTEVHRCLELNFVRPALALTRDGKHFLTGHQLDPVLRLGEVQTGKPVRTYEGHMGPGHGQGGHAIRGSPWRGPQRGLLTGRPARTVQRLGVSGPRMAPAQVKQQ